MSEEGDLYVNCTDLSYEGFGGDNINLANALHDGSCVYRRIETPMTEREEFIEEMSRYATSSVLGKMFEAGCRLVN